MFKVLGAWHDNKAAMSLFTSSMSHTRLRAVQEGDENRDLHRC